MNPLTPIGQLHSPFRDKFGIPRQPGLAPNAEARLELLPPFNHPDCVRGLEAFSHVWLIFTFHGTQDTTWRPLIRPPRLGGNEKIGVFASRSTVRPNPLGLSVVTLRGIDYSAGVQLLLSGVDLLDGTPIVDIKPYLPYADAHPEAHSAYADPLPRLRVKWTDSARTTVTHWQQHYPQLAALIEDVLAQDPRPAFHDDPTRHYGVRLYQLDVRFCVRDKTATVIELVTT